MYVYSIEITVTEIVPGHEPITDVGNAGVVLCPEKNTREIPDRCTCKSNYTMIARLPSSALRKSTRTV